MKKQQTTKIGRKADDGQFCSIKYAQAHPKTTVVETIKQIVKQTPKGE